MVSAKRSEKRELASVPERVEQARLGVGGSVATEWNTMLANQTVNTLAVGDDEETQRRQYHAAALGLIGISPRDELEGMMAAQLIAAYNATMECYRRAAVPDQTSEGRRENLNQANKLSRTYTMLLEALNRHRGKGQQKVTVEHVHVHAGGQAVVGMVEAPGGGDRANSEERPHGKQVAHAPEPEMRRPDEERDSVPVARDGERPVPDTRGKVARRSGR
jgi:hypothetical protein